MNRWTVHVTDFGKIEDAEVEVAPMTLFVGDNNSGKSYMMTLIYGLLTTNFFLDNFRFATDSIPYQECCAIVDKMLEGEVLHDYILCGGEIKKFENLINQLLEDNKEMFLMDLFNKKMTVGKLWITFSKEASLKFNVSRSYDKDAREESVAISFKMDEENMCIGYSVKKKLLQQNGRNGYPVLLSYIMDYMLQLNVEEDEDNKEITYLPTTRTGFLLTYKTLASNAMQEKFTLETSNKNLLTKPNSDFLRELSSMNVTEEKKKFQKLVEFIENNVITGHISASQTPAPDFLYMPEGTKQKLPLFVTSGVVTEMTPLVLFLKYYNLGTLLMEEPEISLHPQLQWQIARVLIRLMNMGVPVFVTTHSDIILQHINNMIKASDLPEREKFLGDSGYEEEDLLSRNDIRVYQFDVLDNQKTKVQKLPCGDYGFEAMTFYDTLQELNAEIDKIENTR